MKCLIVIFKEIDHDSGRMFYNGKIFTEGFPVICAGVSETFIVFDLVGGVSSKAHPEWLRAAALIKKLNEQES